MMKSLAFVLVLGIALAQDARGVGSAPVSSPQGSAQGKALDVPPKHVVVATDKGKLLILIDLFPFADQLKAKPAAEANSIVTATAARYAELHAAKKEYSALTETTVLIVYVKNMDEYNRPNYGGMVRHGTLTYRKGQKHEMTLVENKLNFKANP